MTGLFEAAASEAPSLRSRSSQGLALPGSRRARSVPGLWPPTQTLASQNAGPLRALAKAIPGPLTWV